MVRSTRVWHTTGTMVVLEYGHMVPTLVRTRVQPHHGTADSYSIAATSLSMAQARYGIPIGMAYRWYHTNGTMVPYMVPWCGTSWYHGMAYHIWYVWGMFGARVRTVPFGTMVLRVVQLHNARARVKNAL